MGSKNHSPALGPQCHPWVHRILSLSQNFSYVPPPCQTSAPASTGSVSSLFPSTSSLLRCFSLSSSQCSCGVPLPFPSVLERDCPGGCQGRGVQGLPCWAAAHTTVAPPASREECVCRPEPDEQPGADPAAPGLPDGEAGDGPRAAAVQCPVQHPGARRLPHPHGHEVLPEGVRPRSLPPPPPLSRVAGAAAALSRPVLSSDVHRLIRCG